VTRRVLVTAGACLLYRPEKRAGVRGQRREGARLRHRREGLDDLARDIPGMATTICDISKREDLERMMDAAVGASGGLDVLVNNAGISGPTVPVEEAGPDAWEAVVRVNLPGTFHVTRLAIPHLKKSPRGDHHVVGGRPVRVRRPARLPGDQVGVGRVHEDALDRTRSVRHPRERHPAQRRERPTHPERSRRPGEVERSLGRRGEGGGALHPAPQPLRGPATLRRRPCSWPRTPVS